MYRVEIANAGGYLFNIKSKDYEFAIDTQGKGITPPDTLLASLGTCVGVYLRKYAEGTKLGLKEFTITVSADFSQDKPMRFKDINVSINLKGAQLNEMQRNGLMAFIKNCPVHNTLKMNPHIAIEIGE